jgi:hypothetical protein
MTGDEYLILKDSGSTSAVYVDAIAFYDGSGGFNTYIVSYSNQTYQMTFVATSSFSLLWVTQLSPNLIYGFPATNTTSSTSLTITQACQLNAPLACNISIREIDTAVYTGTTMLY